MANKIVTYLSLPRDKEPPLCSYAWPAGDGRKGILNGRQTNEAPLQYFLSTFDFSGSEDQILCLCTEEVREYVLAWCGRTTFDYVKQSLTAYCAEHEISCPAFVDVPVDSLENDLELALAEIMKRIMPEDRVYIDATGGPRDANFMNILLMQALQYKGCPVVEMVYSFFSTVDQTKNCIRKLNDVSRIMRMTGAMAELTTYGRTRLFEQMSGELDGETVELVKKLHGLSETLEVSSFSADGQGPNFNKILTEINQALARCRKSEQLRPLMRQFLPVFREKLSFGNSNITLASVVRWCAENHLLQQSVTIFYENIYAELRNQGILYILPDRHTPDGHISYANDLTSRFLSECAKRFPTLYTNSVHKEFPEMTEKFLNRFLDDTVSFISDRVSFSSLGLLLLDCQLTRLIRNQMSHSVIYTEQSVKRRRAGKEMDCFYRMGQSNLVVHLPVEEIRKRMTAAAERLDSLCAQAAGKIVSGRESGTVSKQESGDSNRI